MVRKNVVAVIPARGGSKRIKNKNIVDFCGEPMLAKTILAAQHSDIFDRIIVSTDSADIAAVAEQYGVEVPFYRENAKDDFSTVSEATIEALRQAKTILNETYNMVVQLMANCPLRTEYDIVRAVDNFKNKENEFQISCFKFGWMNPWWAMKLNEDMEANLMFPETVNKRSQDLPDLYCPTGAIWIAKTDALIKAKTFYGKGYKMFPMPWQSAVDIDNYDDLEMAKYFYQARMKQ